MQKNELERLKSENLRDYTGAIDISCLNIENNKSREERAIDFFMFVQNPYIFRVGDITVKINFKGEKGFLEAVVKAVNSV